MKDRLLTISEAADRLRVSRDFVYDRLWRRLIVGVRVGRLWRIPESALDRYLELAKRGLG